jgi:serine/threonine-protein kinase ATR
LDDSFELVVPFQKTLMATLPVTASNSAVIKNKPFPYDHVTVAGFQDEVLILSSLQRPRKLMIRGADGQTYPILCKPRDDLRKDQRLMEFNAMIDRALKRDVDASKRKLYIKTYAVTTLNDEHGVLEWVDGLMPLRDIIIKFLSQLNIKVEFSEARALLDKACREAHGEKLFTEKLLTQYPPVLYKWFIETFPDPDAWFNARLRYTRSCGVASIVGNALGLGDRHGENISLEQGSGGVFHVDFNCLFDKGLTFEKPEKVPFRLTHNIVQAFGVYGYEGPFRIAAEITQRTLKQHEETLMTIMEAFLYDPTADFGLEKRKRIEGVPDTPADVLQNVKLKFNCLLKNETVPLSVEGYVDVLIRAATDPKNLMHMYVGWCSFL